MGVCVEKKGSAAYQLTPTMYFKFIFNTSFFPVKENHERDYQTLTYPSPYRIDLRNRSKSGKKKHP